MDRSALEILHDGSPYDDRIFDRGPGRDTNAVADDRAPNHGAALHDDILPKHGLLDRGAVFHNASFADDVRPAAFARAGVRAGEVALERRELAPFARRHVS